MNHDELKQQIPDDLKEEYAKVSSCARFSECFPCNSRTHLIERIAKAEAELKTVLDRESASQKRHDDRIAELEAKLPQARKEALEEAAKLADRLELYKGVTVAREIRALIAKEPA